MKSWQPGVIIEADWTDDHIEIMRFLGNKAKAITEPEVWWYTAFTKQVLLLLFKLYAYVEALN